MRDDAPGVPAPPTSTAALWSLVAIGFGIMFLSSAIKGAYQVYFLDLSQATGLGRGTFALTGALFGLCLGVVSPLVGGICDRFGAYASILSGAATAVLAFGLLGLLPSFGIFLLAYGVLAAYAFAAMTFVPMGVLVDQLFNSQQKGLAYALVSNGTAIGFMLLSPLWVWFNGWLDWRYLALGLAAAFALLIFLPVAWASTRLPLHRPSLTQGPPEGRVLDLVRGSSFALLALSFAGCGASMAFLDIHLVPLMQERLQPGGGGQAGVASTLSILGLMEFCGALAVGYFTRFQRLGLMLAGLYAFRALSVCLLLVADQPRHFMLFGAAFGLTYMGTVIITSMLCMQCYGPRTKGRMFGLLFSVHQGAVFLTAYLGGLARDLTGNYLTTVLGITAILLVSMLAGLLLAGQRETGKAKPAGPVPEPSVK